MVPWTKGLKVSCFKPSNGTVFLIQENVPLLPHWTQVKMDNLRLGKYCTIVMGKPVTVFASDYRNQYKLSRNERICSKEQLKKKRKEKKVNFQRASLAIVIMMGGEDKK